jgi:hypothetical protein
MATAGSKKEREWQLQEAKKRENGNCRKQKRERMATAGSKKEKK